MPRYDGSLQAPAHLDQVFLHRNGNKVQGMMGLKPGRVLWSVKKNWYSVSLTDFEAWIVGMGRRVKM